MRIPVPFRWAVLVPFAAVLAPDEPMDRSTGNRFVGGENGGVEVDDGIFVDRKFHRLCSFLIGEN
jgi:hypothetical protein